MLLGGLLEIEAKYDNCYLVYGTLSLELTNLHELEWGQLAWLNLSRNSYGRGCYYGSNLGHGPQSIQQCRHFYPPPPPTTGSTITYNWKGWETMYWLVPLLWIVREQFKSFASDNHGYLLSHTTRMTITTGVLHFPLVIVRNAPSQCPISQQN